MMTSKQAQTDNITLYMRLESQQERRGIVAYGPRKMDVRVHPPSLSKRTASNNHKSLVARLLALVGRVRFNLAWNIPNVR